MSVLIDTSVWVEYFRNGTHGEQVDSLLDEDLAATNDLILAELVPFLRLRNQRKIITLLGSLTRLPLDIDWDQIMEFQYRCLKAGVNGIGIPDFIIAQNARQHQAAILTQDRHFAQLAAVIPLRLA
ncbi:MAG: PIN domain-containing protein [Thermodesulfobacteriota bacterium]|jgi:predicted nucleic acid-binding protein